MRVKLQYLPTGHSDLGPRTAKFRISLFYSYLRKRVSARTQVIVGASIPCRTGPISCATQGPVLVWGSAIENRMKF